MKTGAINTYLGRYITRWESGCLCLRRWASLRSSRRTNHDAGPVARLFAPSHLDQVKVGPHASLHECNISRRMISQLERQECHDSARFPQVSPGGVCTRCPCSGCANSTGATASSLLKLPPLLLCSQIPMASSRHIYWSNLSGKLPFSRWSSHRWVQDIGHRER
jgi:hypothetical protein